MVSDPEREDYQKLQERIIRLEDNIRANTPELGCLSTMGVHFLECAVRYYQHLVIELKGKS